MADRQISELLRYIPKYHIDPVPPFLFDILDKNILRDLAIISLEHSRSLQELNIKTIDRTITAINKANVKAK